MKTFTAICVLTLLSAINTAAAVTPTRNPETGLLSWQHSDAGLSLQLLQVLPDYVKAVYASRGLPPEAVHRMADYCVFGTILKNTSDRQVSYDVSEWRYVNAQGIPLPVKTKTRWVQEWQDMGLAFRWSILPDKQTFEPGDWGQGFTTIERSAGPVFDLRYHWKLDGQAHEMLIEGIRCAEPG